jgi:hypothetical protein
VAGEDLIDTAEAARLLGVTRQNVNLMIRRRGLLEAVVDRPRLLLVRRADVERLAREGWPGRRTPGRQP